MIFRKIIGFFSRIIFPKFGHCSMCGRTWNICTDYSIQYDDHGSSHFACCEKCYMEMSIDEKIYNYTKISWLDEKKKIHITENILRENNINIKNYYRKKKIKNLL